MADFKQAISWLKKDKPVKRKGQLWHLETDGVGTILIMFLNHKHIIQNLSLEDIESKDWYIFYEDDAKGRVNE